MQSQSIKILVVEDDPDDYILTRDLLAEVAGGGYHLDWARNYQEGLKQIQVGQHDIYLIDYRLGADDGLQLLREAATADLQSPVIFLTGQADLEIDLAAMQAGAADYLVKSSINGQLLERAIRYALERSRLLKEIRELSVRDPLTGLYNRRELQRFLEHELERARRYGHPLSFVLIDIDHFKDINDRFGHQAGDEALKEIAHMLNVCYRTSDLLVRYGGDEFAIVMTETPVDEAWKGADRLRQLVEAGPIKVNFKNDLIANIKITLSIGVAEYSVDASSSDALIATADQALYQAKRQGGNRVVLCNANHKKGGSNNGHRPHSTFDGRG